MARRPERSRASLDHTRLAHDRLWLAGLWLLAFLLYAATTTLDVLPADSGEFQLIAAGWGIGHPPGYPLYTMAAAMWLRIIPVGALPFRASLFSAALAATTLTILARAVELWAGTLGATRRHARLGGALAALALGTASTYWAQATTANIRMPTMLFVAWGYLALAHYRDARGNANRCRRALLELGITAGLGVGHHPSLAFIAAGWAAYLLFESPGTFLRPRQWYRAAFAAAAVWFLPQLYLPLRGAMQNVPLNPGGLSSWKGFWDHVLARGFGGDMLAYATSHDLALRLPLLPTLFRMQFPTLVLVAMALGWAWVLRRDRSTALSLLIAWLAQTFFTITYRAPQTVEYLMPAYVPMAMVLGLAAASRPARGRGAAQRLFATVVGLITLILGLQLPGHVRDFAALAHDTSIRARVEPLLRQAPAGATILADWHWATPLWVLQAVEGLSPDVTVSYVYPEDGRDYDEVWRARAEAASGAPLFTTHAYTWEGWTAAPVGGGYRLYAQPLLSLPFELGFTSIDADLGPIRLLGARFGAARFGAASAKPGATVELQLAWQAKDPAADASFATRLWDNDQALLSASDLALGADTETEGIHFATLTHQLPIDRCSPIVHPTVSIYTVTDAGYLDLGALSLPAFEVDCRYPTLPTERFWPGVVSGQGPFLRGIDYDVRQASATLAYLHWCGPGAPLVIRESESEAQVSRLALGACQTVSLRIAGARALRPELSRLDGSPATLVALPFPPPSPDERYLPFGGEIVLIGETLAYADDGRAILTLRWRTAAPQVDDYAVSVRLQDAEGTWLGMHDMQPGLGAVPTLKWVTRGDLIRDPHTFAALSARPHQFAIAVYERFRLTPLRSPAGDVTAYRLP